MNSEEFRELSAESLRALGSVSNADWTRPALGLTWTCWETVDHMVDCLFSYAFQMAARAPSGFLPFNELRAQSDATPDDLLMGLQGVLTMLSEVLDAAQEDATASDGVFALRPPEWRARSAYELVLHTYDVTSAFNVGFRLSAALARSVIDCQSLWMLDQDVARAATDPWAGLLAGSGRQPIGDS
jgi:hypothetical protein